MILTLPDGLKNLIFLTVLQVTRSARIDCVKDCKKPDYSNKNYKPQDCAKFCPSNDEMGDDAEDFEDLVDEVETLKILIIVLLALVLLMILFLVLILAKNTHLCPILGKIFKKSKKETERREKEKKAISKEAELTSAYVVQYSPSDYHVPKRTSSTISNHVQATPVHRQPNVKTRRRIPSESSCPDESQVEGYDNLGLSTSTLTMQSRPSSPGSPTSEGVGISMAAMNTTMTTIHLDSSHETPAHINDSNHAVN